MKRLMRAGLRFAWQSPRARRFGSWQSKRLMRAWLRLAWQSPRVGRFDNWENRDRLIRQLAPGKTFVDVGGMWNVNGRTAFLAEEAGAERVVLMDVMCATEEFEAEKERRGSAVSYIRGDLHDPATIDELGSFDVVWCTGVIYHSPSPYAQVEHLRRMTGEQLVLGSVVIPELPGVEEACLFFPGQSAAARSEFARAYRVSGMALTEPFDHRPDMGYANYWWGMSPSALRAMLTLAGFEVLEEYSPTPYQTDLVARTCSERAPDGSPA